MSDPPWIAWLLLLLEGGTAGLAFWLWRQLLRVHRNVRRLAREGKVERYPGGPPLVRETLGDLQQIEARLQEIGQRMADEDFSLRAILSSMVEGVMILDPGLRIRLINQRLQEMFSLPRDPAGRTPLEVFRNHQLEQVIAKTLERRVPQGTELQVQLRDDGRFVTRHLQVTSVGLGPGPDREPAGLLVVFHDITRLRTLEAVRKEFVANLSHELRTPLSILSGYLETLLDESDLDRDTSRRFLETMYRHAKRLNALLEGLLLLSQLESGRLSLELTTVRVAECFARVLERFESVIAKTNAEVTRAAPADLALVTDALRLEQALFNLVDNALKYGARDGLRLTLAAERDGEEVLLRVIDNGPGIPLRDQPHLFERFYRVHKDRSRDAGGTGLGLAIVKHSVQALGGQVSLESSPGKGASFTIRLPRSTPAARTRAADAPG